MPPHLLHFHTSGERKRRPATLYPASDGNTTCEIAIPSNCHAALCQIRKHFGAVTIWTDSICINQADKLEKVDQIPLMKDIYTSAETVYIWLGDGNDQSARAISYFKSRAAIMPLLPFACLTAATGEDRRSERRKYWWRVLSDPFRT
jgi:hypothetical protein